MTLNDILQNITAGGVVSIVIIILSLIEITPIKLSPLQWIGRRINHDIEEQVDSLTERVEKLDDKLNDHMVESYRTSILDFADRVMSGQIFTNDKWGQMLNICSAYEKIIADNHLTNGQATQAIIYI